jgi:nitrogen regulatory protein P-II 1
MKKVEAIIRIEKVAAVSAALRLAGHFKVTISEGGWHDKNSMNTEKNTNGAAKHEMPPTVRLAIVAEDEDVENIIITIREACHAKKIGDSKVIRHPLHDTIYIRSVK